MSDGPSRTPMERFFRACLLVLGGIIAVTVALELLALIWVWLVVIAGVGIAIFGAYTAYQWWRDRHW